MENKTKNMKKIGLDEIHMITLDLMDQFHNFCEENNLVYVLNNGTLLGAIRHKGFIPWDDDFDVMMPRKDYDRLFALLENKCDGRYRLITRGNTPNYYNGIARFCDMKYIYQTELDVKQYEQGVFIDVYPLDACGKDEEETEKVHLPVRKLNAKYIMYCNKTSLSSKARTLLRIPYYYYLHFRYGKNFGKNIEQMTRDIIYSHFNDHSEYVGMYWENKDFRLYQRNWMDKREMHDFEDRKYWISSEYDAVLTTQYGDYMTPPPQDQRIGNHSYSIYEIE